MTIDVPGSSEAGHLTSEHGFGLVEVLVAVIILSVGLLAIAGITVGVARQTNRAVIVTDQMLAGQQVLEAAVQAGYGNVATSDTTISVGGRSYRVSRSVTQVSPDVEEVEVVIPGVPGRASPETLRIRLHD